MPSAPKINFDIVRDSNVEQLKVLNRAIFPIKYQVRLETALIPAQQSNITCVSEQSAATVLLDRIMYTFKC